MSLIQKKQAAKQLFNDENWIEMKSNITKMYYDPENIHAVTDHLFIQKQTELMQEIKQKIHRSKYKQNFGGIQILPIDSSLSNISSAYNFDNDQSLIKSKFTEQFQNSLVNSALKEVKSTCSEQTYQTVKNYIINNKQKQCENLSKMLEKKSKQNQELSLTIILKQNELNKLRQEMSPYLAKVEYFQEQKKKWKKKNDQIGDKQKMIHKAEMALIFKEKIYQEVKKKNQRMKQFSSEIESKMLKIESSLNQIWKEILKKMESYEQNPCCSEIDPKNCWKKQVMKKCRQKLLEERNLLKQQQKQLQKEYEVMQSISEQFKKLINDPQEGSQLINTNNAGISSINQTQKQESVMKNNAKQIQNSKKTDK